MTQQRKPQESKHSTKPTTPTRAPTFLRAPETIQEQLALGELAAQALKNPAMQYAQSLVVQSLQNEWLESAPEEKARRDGLYWTNRGMAEYIGMLNGFIQHAQHVQSQQENL